MQEIWMPISGCEGAYSVSNEGRVKSHERNVPHRVSGHLTIKERILKNNTSGSHGYAVVNIKRNGVQSPRLVHRLVAEAFLGACPDGQECAHLDGNRSNPKLENLRWSSPVENNRDKVLHKTQISGERVHFSRLLPNQVAKIKSDKRTQAEIAACYGVNQSTVSRILSVRTWKNT